MRKLKTGGRAAVVIKNTVLSNTDNASIALRRELLQSCNLHAILDCPQGTFQGAGVKTVVLFFDKGRPTRDIWYYQLDPGRSLGKTNPLNDNDLAEFVSLQATKADTEKSWAVSVDDIDEDTYDLSVKNPNAPEEAPLRAPEEIIDEMTARDEETKGLIASGGSCEGGWRELALEDLIAESAERHLSEAKQKARGRVTRIETIASGELIQDQRMDRIRL